MRNLLLLLILISSLGIAQENKPYINNNIEGVTCELPIPDNVFVTGVSGTVANMVCVTVAGPGGIVSDMSVEISLDHTWVGDITAIVVAPDMTTMVTILDRPSRTDNAGAGDSSNFIETAPITFADSSANDSDDMGNTIAGAEFVCQDDGVCDYFHIQDETINGNNLADFNGMNATGNWQICVGDSASGDQGGVCAAGTSITFINIGAVAVPTPANGMTIDFMMNPGFNLSILNDLGAGANDDLDNIQCGFSGGDAGQFSITSGQPAGPIAPGNSAIIALAVNAVPTNTVYTSTLSCTFDNDLDDSSFSWPVSASGPVSAVAVTSIMNASPMAFGTNTTFNFDMANDTTAMLDLDNINCSYSGGDSGQFSVTSGQPAGPITPGNSANIALAVNAVPVNIVYTSTLSCIFDNDLDDSSFSWPVSASGPVSAVAVPSVMNASPLAFGMNTTFNFDMANDATAMLDLVNINCSYSGGDAGQFSVTSGQPAGPVAPGNSTTINLAVNPVPINTIYNSTLTCTFDNDIDSTSFGWPVSASGAISAIAIPSLADGETISFGTASDSRIRIRNALSAGLDLDSINCSYMGADAMQYSIASAQPAGPVAPGGFVYIDLYVNDVPDGQTYTSTLSCTFINDINVSSFSWPVIASGPEVIPTLSQYGLALLLGLMLLMGFRFQRKQ